MHSRYALRVFPYLKPYWRLSVLACLGIVLAGLTALLIPWPLQIVVDNVLGNRPLPHTLQVILGPAADRRGLLLVIVVAAGLLITLIHNAISVLNSYLT